MIKFIQLPVCSLSAFLNNSDTSFDVAGFLLNDGTTAVDPTDIGDICYATIEPRTVREELVSFTIDSVTAGGVATLTVTRGLSQIYPYGTGGATFEHQSGSNFVISNNPGLLNKFAVKENDEAITGDWTVPTPAGANSVTPKTYVDTLDGANVKKTGNQTIAGVKTFTSPLTIPDGVADTDAVSKLQTETYANTKVSKTGNETIVGTKTFSSNPVVPDATAANHPYTKGQHDADAEAASAVASPTVRGTAKLDRVADTPADPEVLTATAERLNFINAQTGMIVMYGSATPPTGFLLCNGQAVSRTTYADLFAVTSTSYGVGDGSTTFNVPDLRSSFPVGYGQKTKAFTFNDAAVNTGTDVITVTSNKYLYDGKAVVLSTNGTLPTGLSATTYYVIYVSDTTIKLATSRANADDGIAVDITAAAGGGTHTLTLTLTSRAMGDEGGEESHTIQTEELASHAHTAPNYSVGSNSVFAEDSSGAPSSGLSTNAAGGDTPHNTMPPFVTVNYIIKT